LKIQVFWDVMKILTDE